MNIKELAKELVIDFHSVLKSAKNHGFSKGPNDDLDEKIISAIKADFAPKALGAAEEIESLSTEFNPKDLSNASQAEQSTYENHRRATRNLTLEVLRNQALFDAIEEEQAYDLAKAQAKADLNREKQIKLLSENKEMIATFKANCEAYRGETLNVYANGEVTNKDLEQQIARIKSFRKEARYWQN